MEPVHTADASGTGREWLVEAFGCEAGRLTSIGTLQRLFDAAVQELALHPVGAPVWHQFPAPGGITGLWLLAESHLTVHTFPEFGSACLNLFCCTPRPEWAWPERLADLLGATEVRVRRLSRAYGAAEPVGHGATGHDATGYDATARATQPPEGGL